MTPGSLSRMVRQYFEAADIVSHRISPHSLRHSAITFSINGGATLQQAKAMARHQNINTTLIYVHNLDRRKNAAEFKIDNVLGGESEEQVEDEEQHTDEGEAKNEKG